MSRTALARTLRAVSSLYLLVGLVWATAAWAAVDAPGRLLFDLLDWPLDGVPAELGRSARWASAVGAGLLVGLSLVMSLVVAPELERGNRTVARGTVIALLGWFVVDGAGSIASGVTSNALFNVPFLLGWLVPVLLLARRDGGPRAQDAATAANQAAVSSSSA